MCGVIGVIDLSGGAADAVRARMELLRRRGPDGEGSFVEGPLAMGMRRLAIIDPAGGGQPLYARGDRVAAFQNGEIYNHQELRRELEQAGAVFRTRSDTEVLAHGYAIWGIERLLDKLDGMTALAIYDRDAGVLHLARDRFGEKPLFYAAAEGRFAYASNLFAVASLPWVGLTPDPVALDRYLALQHVPGPLTPLTDVRRLEPGERMEVRADDPRPQIFRYYRPPLGRGPEPSPQEMEAMLDAAVRSRLIADVPVGVFLSGGIDSSTVAALAARAQPGVATFSIGFDDPRFDESPYAEKVARHIGSRHVALRFGRDAFNEVFDGFVAEMDEPLGDQAVLPTYLLSREARRDVVVALSGEGADEVFAGYEHYRAYARGAAAPTVRGMTDGPATPAGQPHLLGAADRRALLGRDGLGAPQPWETALTDWLDGAVDPLQRVCAADLTTAVPDRLLVKVDRAGMAAGLEVRAPFLARAVAEVGLRLPPQRRLTGNVTKAALREAAARLLPPDALARPKQVFAVPLLDWLRDRVNDRGGPQVYARNHALPVLDSDVMGRLLALALQPGRHSNLAFTLCMLMEWHTGLTRALRRLRFSSGGGFMTEGR